MTLLTGFSAEGHQYLIADAAITSEDDPRRARDTSFGESHRATRRGFVHESAIKLFELSAHVVGGYCGRVASGLESLHAARHSLMLDPRIETALEQAQRRLVDAELLIAGLDSDGFARRWHVTADRILEDYVDGETRVLGSASSPREAFVAGSFKALTDIPEIRTNPDHLLAAGIVALQAHGQREELLDENIGGAFWGLRTSSSGCVRQQDIMYVMFDPNRDITNSVDALSTVVTGQREHAAFAWRVRLRNQGLRIFVGDVTYVSDDEIASIAPTMFDVQPHYLAFVQRRIGSVLLCARRQTTNGAGFSIRYDRGAVHLTLDRSIIDHLSGFPTLSPDGVLPREVPYEFLAF